MSKYLKKINLTAIFLFVFIFVGCGAKEPAGKYTDEQLAVIPHPNRDNLPQPTGGLVLSVNGQTLASEEIISVGIAGSQQLAKQSSYEDFAQAVYPYIHQIIIDRVTNMLLYQKAKVTLPEAVFEDDGPLDKAVDSEIRKFLASHHNNYALAQRELEQQGYDWRSYRQYQRKHLLAQMYFGKSIDDKKEVTFNDMLSFYNQNKEEFKREPKTEFQLIHIRKGDDKVKALETAQKALQDLEEGKDFSACVQKYSQGIKAAVGGFWQTADPSSFIPPYDRVIEAIADMHEGEVSDIIDTDEHLFIVKLLENTEAGYFTLTEVQKDIKQHIQAQRRREQVEKLLEELFEQANIAGLEGFLQYCVQQIYVRGKAN